MKAFEVMNLTHFSRHHRQQCSTRSTVFVMQLLSWIFLVLASMYAAIHRTNWMIATSSEPKATLPEVGASSDHRANREAGVRSRALGLTGQGDSARNP